MIGDTLIFAMFFSPFVFTFLAFCFGMAYIVDRFINWYVEK